MRFRKAIWKTMQQIAFVNVAMNHTRKKEKKIFEL